MKLPILSSACPLPTATALGTSPGPQEPPCSKSLKPWLHHQHKALRNQKCGSWSPEQNPLVMLSRWKRSCKCTFSPSPPIHLSFLSFSPFPPCWNKQGWTLLWRCWVLQFEALGKTEITRAWVAGLVPFLLYPELCWMSGSVIFVQTCQ